MPGFTSVGLSPTNGVKIRPSFTSLKPSGAISIELRHDRVAARKRLRRGGRLARLLRHRLLVDADRAACRSCGRGCRPSPSCRPRRCALRSAPPIVDVEQHDGIRRVVVPDVVMHLLEVPAVFAGLRLDRDDRRGVQVVAGANGAVVVGARIAGREVDEPELGIDGRRLPHRRAAVLPRRRCPAATSRGRARPGPESCRTSRRACRPSRRTPSRGRASPISPPAKPMITSPS